MSVLKRLGNKQKFAHLIIPLLPPHRIYIEPFFGAGGMFFNKPQAQHNILNDLDNEVYNFWQVISSEQTMNELCRQFRLMPIHSGLFNYWKHNQEADSIKKALRFLFLSNFSYLGKLDTLTLNAQNEKIVFFERIQQIFEKIQNVKFGNYDFRKFIKSLAIRDEDKPSTFIYCDPPYLNTTNTYNDNKTWQEQDCIDMLDALQNTNCKFAVSEFENDFITEQVKNRDLIIHSIVKRRNINSKQHRLEILVTNYEPNLQPVLF